MTEQNQNDDPAKAILDAENRYCQEVTVTRVNGTCPYGHREGDRFRVTAMNSDGICGALLKSIFFQVTALHYAGSIVWETGADAGRGSCPEGGTVEVAIQRVVREETTLLKTPCALRDMTGKGYGAVDRYRTTVEVLDIAGNCYWGHAVGDRFEVDPFNTGGACCMLYAQLYPYIHVLLTGTSPPWASDDHAVIGECPDTYNRLMFRLTAHDRKSSD